MKVLIADDNALVRSWLKIILQQIEGEEFQILEAEDGNEALHICLDQPVDLLITDIKMPGQDGISLIKTLLAERPELCAAVLSGYDDFEYVRVALKCGALDYILKAEMKQEDVSALVQKVREKKLLSQSTGHYLAHYQKDVQQARAAYDAYMQGQGTEDLLRCCLPPGMETGCITMLIVEEHPAERQVAAVCCAALKSEGLFGVAFPLEQDTLLMLYALDTETAQRERHLRLLSALDQNLTAAHMGILRQNVNLTFNREGGDFHHKLHYARELIDYQIYYECSAVPAGKEHGHQEERTLLENLQAQVNVQNYRRACELLEKYVENRHAARDFPSRIRRTVTASMQVMFSALTYDSRQSEDYQQLDRLIYTAGRALTGELLRRRVSRFCAVYDHYAGYQQRETYSPSILRAVAYCNENYSRKVTLDEIASYVRLNKSYFSQLFHKEVGLSFGDYLESVRIKNAQQLLREQKHSMSEISEMVGFSNQNYFTKVFKKATGATPSQYRTAYFNRTSAEEEGPVDAGATKEKNTHV